MTVTRIALLMVLGVSAGCLDSSLGEVPSVDVPASQLGIEPTIVDDTPEATDGKVPVSVQFFHSNQFVKLDSAVVRVNGVTLPWSAQGYTARIPLVAAGGTITFEHVRGGTTAQLVYHVPARPVITSPTTNEVVARLTNVTVMYQSASSSGVRPLGLDGGNLLASGGEQTDNGMAFLDASGLRPGPGSISVERRYVTSPPGGSFLTAAVTYTISSPLIPVSWQ
ncbi:MAG TPA: hypothetical protein VHW23_01100 [Kofleriaceae bacterium]|jgi:hypothetical protein|nr:hypothetical protein [Kofleriaceae bacterium]